MWLFSKKILFLNESINSVFKCHRFFILTYIYFNVYIPEPERGEIFPLRIIVSRRVIGASVDIDMDIDDTSMLGI